MVFFFSLRGMQLLRLTCNSHPFIWTAMLWHFEVICVNVGLHVQLNLLNEKFSTNIHTIPVKPLKCVFFFFRKLVFYCCHFSSLSSSKPKASHRHFAIILLLVKVTIWRTIIQQTKNLFHSNYRYSLTAFSTVHFFSSSSLRFNLLCMRRIFIASKN